MVKTQIIPADLRISGTASDGTILLEKKKQRRRRFKTSAKTRARIRTAARKFKLPVLTGAAVALPVIDAIQSAKGLPDATSKLRQFSKSIVRSYTGLDFTPDGVKFDFGAALRGWGPLIGIGILKKTPFLRGVQRMVAKLGFPVSFS